MTNHPPAARALKAGLAGTNLELMGDYNQRLVYQAIRTRGPITRALLIALTGLAKPTVAAIVKRLLLADLVVETSRLYGGRGQPAVYLEVNPRGCFAVGVRVARDRHELVVVDACGTPVRRAAADRTGSDHGATSAFVRRRLAEQVRDVPRDRIIGLGVVAAGGPDAEAVVPDHADLAAVASGLPVFPDSELAAAAAGEALFGAGAEWRSCYCILLGPRPVGGLVLHRTLHCGAHPHRRRPLFPAGDPPWLDGAAASDEDAWLTVAARDLVPLLVSISCMFDPGGVVFAGPWPADRLARLAERCAAGMRETAPEIPSHPPIRAARLGADATLIGAACLPMRARLAPTGEALLKERGGAA